ncbi:hypothetical protein BDV26DRAFT_290644 [Aspergillus bertholletiae]|uniref:Uncharacterized protein n=1 Tax=Aspergillus bertholletiae TaxID=1226010 RepID=A0A5N7BE75_9EURO|nr:hypothetical protein BDV26DRAFT_290644 [Aspergillus bertholletiae]
MVRRCTMYLDAIGGGSSSRRVSPSGLHKKRDRRGIWGPGRKQRDVAFVIPSIRRPDPDICIAVDIATAVLIKIDMSAEEALDSVLGVPGRSSEPVRLVPAGLSFMWDRPGRQSELARSPRLRVAVQSWRTRDDPKSHPTPCLFSTPGMLVALARGTWASCGVEIEPAFRHYHPGTAGTGVPCKSG